MLQPREIAQKLWTSEKTVYNYRSRLKGQIKEEKRSGKTFLDFEAISEAFRKAGNQIPNEGLSDSPKASPKEVLKGSESVTERSAPKTAHSPASSEAVQNLSENAQKANANLTEQVSKYAIMLREEKAEKQERKDRYDKVDSDYRNAFQKLSEVRYRAGILIAALSVFCFCLILFMVLYGFGIIS